VVVGALGLVLSFAGLALDIGFIAQPFYAWAWWSYILFVDGLVARWRGRSLLTTRRSLLPAILLWSITFWYFFELLNLRFQNWYYVGVFGDGMNIDFLRTGLFGIVAFSTVFVGLFETYDALAALRLFDNVRTRGIRIPTWLSYGLQAVGATLVATSLVFSHYLAPLIWSSLTFLVDPWNYRRGARSLLADVERGRVDVVLRLLVAGLICGLIWESFNFLAPQKWIYTVRGLEDVKLFEMPLLGFLGFPALALDAFAAFAAVSFLFYGNTTWENAEDVPPPLPRPTTALSRRAQSWCLPLHLAFWASVSLVGHTTHVGSIELRLSHLETLSQQDVSALHAIGLRRPRQLLRALESPRRRSALRDEMVLDAASLAAVEDEARLLTFKGIGPHHGRLLRRIGVVRVDDLAGWDAHTLHQALERERLSSFPALRPEMVRVWVSAASDLKR